MQISKSSFFGFISRVQHHLQIVLTVSTEKREKEEITWEPGKMRIIVGFKCK